MKRKTEYITIKTHSHLIGKRAKFKSNDNRLGWRIWGKSGVIKQKYSVEKGDLDHIGLSLVFDEGMNNAKNNWGLDSCYILPNSFILEVEK